MRISILDRKVGKGMKLVWRKPDGSMHSLTHKLRITAAVEYKFNIWVGRNTIEHPALLGSSISGPLTVFRSHMWCMNFIQVKIYYNPEIPQEVKDAHRVYPCQYTVCESASVLWDYNTNFTTAVVDRQESVPMGTDFADDVMLIPWKDFWAMTYEEQLQYWE